MAFTVTTYRSEQELASALAAIVTTHPSEAALASAIAAAVAPWGVVAKGGYYTLIDNPLISNISLRIVSKGGFFTVILETI